MARVAEEGKGLFKIILDYLKKLHNLSNTKME
jgi:hypothetical protein